MNQFLSIKRLRKQKPIETQLAELPRGNAQKAEALFAEVQTALDEVNSHMDEQKAIHDRYRTAGFMPSEAEALLRYMKTRPVAQITPYGLPRAISQKMPSGEIVQSFTGGLFVRDPNNLVVPAQQYLDFLQDSVLKWVDNWTEDSVQTVSWGRMIKLLAARIFRVGR